MAEGGGAESDGWSRGSGIESGGEVSAGVGK